MAPILSKDVRVLGKVVGLMRSMGSDPLPPWQLRCSDRGLSTQRLRAVRTLDNVISAVWAQITADRAVACPICQGEMEPQYGTGGFQVAGRCRDCGSVLS